VVIKPSNSTASIKTSPAPIAPKQFEGKRKYPSDLRTISYGLGWLALFIFDPFVAGGILPYDIYQNKIAWLLVGNCDP